MSRRHQRTLKLGLLVAIMQLRPRISIKSHINKEACKPVIFQLTFCLWDDITKSAAQTVISKLQAI